MATDVLISLHGIGLAGQNSRARLVWRLKHILPLHPDRTLEPPVHQENHPIPGVYSAVCNITMLEVDPHVILYHAELSAHCNI
ncbi:hypothetical protein J4Q44_G00083080 [Coregonus suidteri]|uniref:Uncharacterized protein n=1 Tax=Coregonus suidteri TaxID=861788 RepID=A0AAN8M5Y1_9TELE